ncbi:ribosome-inactivating family protein [Streptomyces huasconensis]|uniref:ribosome-inactivating family protein n=1 Tax=Streptomyces huasconensis TaxID=1854574 RepID=UPI0036FA40E8
MQGLAAPQAFAATNNLWTEIDWRMDDYQERRMGHDSARHGGEYVQLVRRLRQLASDPMAGTQGMPDLYDTTVRRQQDATQRVIRIALWSNANPSGEARSDVALYFSVDNLYLMGFSSRGRHYRFDAPFASHLASSMQRRYGGGTPIVSEMSSSGDYASLNASPTWRGNQPYTADNFMHHLNELENATPDNMNDNGVRRALAFFIGATSEAARFGFIERRIGNVLVYNNDPDFPGRPAHLGGFGTDLQNNWNTLSAMVHRNLNGEDPVAVRIDGRTYRTVHDVLNGLRNGAGPRIAPFIAIVGSGMG